MATNRNNFFGISLVPSTSTSNTTPGDLEYLTDGKLHVFGATANDSIVQEALAQTLTNKTLTAPVIATIVNTGTLTLPTTTDTLVGRTTTDTLTNKTISGTNNTLTAIANGSLVNSSITINGTSVSLGGTVTVSATASSALTIGTGLTGGSYNGSTPVTVAIDTAVVTTLTGTQTLTNKTLSGATLNTPAINNATALVGGTGVQLQLQNNTQAVNIKVSPAATATYTITLPAAAPTAATALVFDGTNYTWATAGGWTTSTQNPIAAGGTITLGTGGQQLFLVAGTGGPTTLSVTPFGTTPPINGACLRVQCISNINTITLVNNNATHGCIMNGNVTLAQYNMIEFQYSTTLARYVEAFRNF